MDGNLFSYPYLVFLLGRLLDMVEGGYSDEEVINDAKIVVAMEWEEFVGK